MFVEKWPLMREMGREEFAGHKGVASVLSEERKTQSGQTGRGDNGNKQKDGERWVLEIQTQICE